MAEAINISALILDGENDSSTEGPFQNSIVFKSSTTVPDPLELQILFEDQTATEILFQSYATTTTIPWVPETFLARFSVSVKSRTREKPLVPRVLPGKIGLHITLRQKTCSQERT